MKLRRIKRRLFPLFLCFLLALPAVPALAEETDLPQEAVCTEGTDPAADPDLTDPAPSETEPAADPDLTGTAEPDPSQAAGPPVEPAPSESEPATDPDLTGTAEPDPSQAAEPSAEPDPSEGEEPAFEPAISPTIEPESPETTPEPGTDGRESPAEPAGSDDPAIPPAPEPEITPAAGQETKTPVPEPEMPDTEGSPTADPAPPDSEVTPSAVQKEPDAEKAPAPGQEPKAPAATITPAVKQEVRENMAEKPKASDPKSGGKEPKGSELETDEETKTVEPADAVDLGTPDEVDYNELLFSSAEEYEAFAAQYGDQPSYSLRSSPSLTPSTYPRFSSQTAAVNYVRQQLLAHNELIGLCLSAEQPDKASDLWKAAVAYSDSCSGQEGDALYWNSYGRKYYTNLGSSPRVYDGVSYYYYVIQLTYFSTVEQENILTSEVQSALASLNLGGCSNAGKAIRIHKYICDHVDYDHDNKGDREGHPEIYTAYGAMHNGMAVCLGYALLFYRMCKDAGVSPVRVISGTSGFENGGGHAWNIVGQGGYYYNVDTTWDGQGATTKNTYLMKSEADFKNHIRDARYETASFHNRHPMSPQSWLHSPELTGVADNICGCACLSWESVHGASKYRVYRKAASEEDYTYWAQTTSLSYIDRSTGTMQYSYKVLGVDSDNDTIQYTVVNVTTGTVKVSFSVNVLESTGRPQITYTTMSGASKFQLYRATSQNGSYSLLKTLSVPASYASYEDTSAVLGKTYYYKMRAVSSSLNEAGPFTEVKSCKCVPGKPVLTVTANSIVGGIRLNWTSVETADMYFVYRAVGSASSNYTYWYYADSDETTWFDHNVTPDTVYYYYVTACNSARTVTADSEIRGIYYDAAELNVYIGRSADTGQPELSWNKLSGAVYYEVWQKPVSGGSWKKFRETKKTTATDTTASYGKSYVYRVRGFDADGNAGAYSYSSGIRVLFKDVPATHAYFNAVYWAADNGVATGYTDGSGKFGIRDSITRGQFVMMLWRAAGKPKPSGTKQTFKDVPTTHSYYKAIQWAYEEKITTGYLDGSNKFGVNDSVTRGQLMTFLWRYAGKPAPMKTKAYFKDVPATHSYFKAIQWAYEQGITEGYSDGTFGVNKTCTRGHCVQFLYKHFS